MLTESFAPRAVYDTALSRALLGQVARGAVPESLRLYAPGEVLAFSLFDRRQAGFDAAVREAHLRGFRPVLRLTGGRAAVFHGASLGFGWCLPTDDARAGIRERFDQVSSILKSMLSRLGIDARVGSVPNEYCPGDHSVNARGVCKLVGIGQRLIHGAAYVGGVLLVADAERARQVLEPVYQALDLPFDPDTVGSVSDEIGEISVDAVAAALIQELSRCYDIAQASFDDATLRLAGQLEPRHRVTTERASPATLTGSGCR